MTPSGEPDPDNISGPDLMSLYLRRAIGSQKQKAGPPEGSESPALVGLRPVNYYVDGTMIARAPSARRVFTP
jgi:hypothetical protein